MNRGRFRNNRNYQHRNDKKPEVIENADDSNPVVKSFREYADELNDKHDRYERIIKHSRDITIESKRLIFLLHTVDVRKLNADRVLSDASARLTALCSNSFASIAKELTDCDPYQYGRAYSAGIQEFIEAYTYYNYLCNDRITDWKDLQLKLSYAEKTDDDSNTASSDESKDVTKEFKCLIQPIEFMLGLADLSGEIMRKCINALGSGDVETCHRACSFVQHLYSE